MERLIIVLVIVLAVIAIAQLLRVYELASKLKGNREEDISRKDNELNANLWLVFMISFYAFFIWLLAEYGGNRFGKGPSASDIGEKTDWLLDLNFVIITIIFFLTNSLLFIFAWKYYYREDRKALYYPHNNKLELLWTVVPSAVLAVIIILGLRTWFDIQDNTRGEEFSKDGKVQEQNIELFSQQFDWFVRYAGEDNELGQSDYKLITGANPVGVITSDLIEFSDSSMQGTIESLEEQLENEGDYLPDWKYEEIESKIIRLNRLKRRLNSLANNIEYDMQKENDPVDWDAIAGNDVVEKGEIFLVKGVKYYFTLRSKDVIHSAYFPHFRAQMNTVPGATTFMTFTPIYTTEEMREKMNDENFNFVLVCNKVCGESHQRMKMNVIVGDEDGFRKWLAGEHPLSQTSAKKTLAGEVFGYIPYEAGQSLFPEPAEGSEMEEVADAEGESDTE